MSVTILSTGVAFSTPVGFGHFLSQPFCTHCSLGTSKLHHFSFWLFVFMLLAHRVPTFVLPTILCFLSCCLFPLLLSVTTTVNFTALHDRDEQWMQIIYVCFLRDSAYFLKTSGCCVYSAMLQELWFLLCIKSLIVFELHRPWDCHGKQSKTSFSAAVGTLRWFLSVSHNSITAQAAHSICLSGLGYCVSFERWTSAPVLSLNPPSRSCMCCRGWLDFIHYTHK